MGPLPWDRLISARGSLRELAFPHILHPSCILMSRSTCYYSMTQVSSFVWFEHLFGGETLGRDVLIGEDCLILILTF